MQETIENAGFTYTRMCHCDGYRTHIYRLGDYELRLRKQRSQFKIRKHGITKTMWLPGDKLQTTLHELALEKA